MSKTGKRIDGNQNAIVKLFRDMGAGWVSTSGDPNIGCDGILLWRGTVKFIEVKNGSLPKSARKLTPNEEKRKIQCEAHGVPFLIVESLDDALKVLGIQ